MKAILSTPEPMVKVRVMTIKDYSEKTLKTLHRLGVLHVEESKELKPVDRAAIEHQRRETGELLTCIENVLAYIPETDKVSLGEDITVLYTRPFVELDSEVRSLYTRLTTLHRKTIRPSEEVKQLTELKDYLGAIAQQAALRPRDLSFSGSYLFSRVFVLPSEMFQASYAKLKDYLLASTVAPLKNETVLYAIAKDEDRRSVESIVTSAGGRTLQVPDEDLPLREFLETVENRIHSLEEELAKRYGELQREAGEQSERILLLREVLSAENERLSVLEKACEAKYVTLVEGWIPEGDIELAISEVKDSIDYVFIDTRKPDELDEPPTKLKNTGVLSPFQTIVGLFGAPKYGELDPTPIISYSFAFFFGIMVGDVIYALGVILATKYLLTKFVDDPQTDGFKLFQRLLYTCGGVAFIVGLLSGSYLGDVYQFAGIDSLAISEGVQHKLQDPTAFIIFALIIGIVHVNIGHALALARGIRERSRGMVVNKIGIFAFQIFGIPYLLHSLLDVDFPVLNSGLYTVCALVMFVGIILIIASSIMLMGRLGGLFWIFDFSGILGDIMSYARLAGVGLATFYLASSFNMMAEIFYDMFGGVVGSIFGILMVIVIIPVGHGINLVLSGLTGFIHSLRLCFVEFMTKFYEGGGKEYSPFKLKSRQ
jgi:V/A-type H+-transporting ATPase subunit I